MTTYIDHDAAQERLFEITADEALLRRFRAQLKASGHLNKLLMEMHNANLSLDYVLFGHGKPLLPKSKNKA